MPARWSPNVTVAAIAAHTSRGMTRYLLVEEETPEGLKLNNPAGHLERGESPLQAVQREALEETTRIFSPDCLVGVYLARFVRPHSEEDVTYLRLAYGGTVGEADPTRSLDTPVQRTLWLSLDELRACQAQHRSALVLQCIEDHAAGRRFSLDAVQAHASLWAPEVKERA